MPIVVDLVPVEGKESCQEICAATVIYFADSGEKIWDIARKYNSSVEEIMRINELTENLLTNSKTLLIPIM
jgi:LysM repeat protein